MSINYTAAFNRHVGLSDCSKRSARVGGKLHTFLCAIFCQPRSISLSRIEVPSLTPACWVGTHIFLMELSTVIAKNSSWMHDELLVTVPLTTTSTHESRHHSKLSVGPYSTTHNYANINNRTHTLIIMTISTIITMSIECNADVCLLSIIV